MLGKIKNVFVKKKDEDVVIIREPLIERIVNTLKLEDDSDIENILTLKKIRNVPDLDIKIEYYGMK